MSAGGAASAGGAGSAQSGGGAVIHDVGYRGFEGSRSGITGAVRSLTWQTARSILGIGRSARHKVFPIIVLVIAALPAVIYVGVAIISRGEWGLSAGQSVSYSELFGFSFVSVVLFAAMVAPEALVRDRRDGMFSMYLATPLTRLSYLGSKTLAVFLVLATITLGPPLLALIGYTVVGDGPNGFGEWMLLLGRLTLAGLAIAALMSSVALAGSCVTDRRAFASVAVAFVMIGGAVAAEVLVFSANYSDLYGLLDPLGTAVEAATRIMGETSDQNGAVAALTHISTRDSALGSLAWVGLSVGIIWLRYRKLKAI